MKNAHLRFGWLTYVKSTEKTTTSIKLRSLDRFIGEVLPDPPRQAKARSHFCDRRRHTGCGGQCGNRSWRQVYGGGAGRAADPSMPGEECAVFQRLNTARRAQKAAASPYLVVGRVCLQQRIVEFGSEHSWRVRKADLSGQRSPIFMGSPECRDGRTGLRTNWKRIRRSSELSASDVCPCWSKARRQQFLSWLSWGVESGAVSLPSETGSIRWPSLSLEDVFVPAGYP